MANVGESVQAALANLGGVITRVWQPHEASPVFARIDFPGTSRRPKIIVALLNGGIKTYTPPRHVVVSKNPRVKNLVMAEKRLRNQTKSASQALRRLHPPPASRDKPKK